jgi:hypothetical protein
MPPFGSAACFSRLLPEEREIVGSAMERHRGECGPIYYRPSTSAEFFSAKMLMPPQSRFSWDFRSAYLWNMLDENGGLSDSPDSGFWLRLTCE